MRHNLGIPALYAEDRYYEKDINCVIIVLCSKGGYSNFIAFLCYELHFVFVHSADDL